MTVQRIMVMTAGTHLQLRCTLAYGDIYGQILVWMLVSFLGLAAGMALMAAEHPIAGIALISLLFLLSFPFLMFSFVITLFNHLILQEQRSP
jgi:hypothetical protein